MDISEYKSGVYKKQHNCSSFFPESVNHHWTVSDAKVNHLLSEADRKLGELNAFSQLIPNVDFFISMHIAVEATKSSRIEGTQTTLEEALQKVENIDPEKWDDWQEVSNYIEAMNYAIERLNKLPLSSRLLKQTHKKLLQGRGKNKQPGEFRRSQNWIGGATLKDAHYVPPHHIDVPNLMSDLEKFLNNDRIHVPHLIRIGIAHYQFESIHPFLDGNGRLGRLLITLYLVSNNILTKPALYISDFFERNCSHYYDNLTVVRTNNNLTQWLTYFLVGILEIAENSIKTFNQIIELQKLVEGEKITHFGKRIPKAKALLKHLYRKPITTAGEVAKVLKIDISTANRLIQEFEKSAILIEKTGYRRNRIFYFEDYLALFRG